MSKIHLLDKDVIDLIAAGEVVVNPASAVKELIENAVDAASKNIDIEIIGGGKSKITVNDDGEGIEPEDLRYAFLRSATSKIEKSIDAIATLGFRGEALSSIAAVSRVKAVSRPRSEVFGHVIELEAGAVVYEGVQPFQYGTSIQISNLFFNLPARLKNMKKDSAEAQAILEVASALALSHPEIRFRMSSEGKELFLTDGLGNLSSTAKQILGNPFVSSCLSIEFEEAPLYVRGFIISPPYMADYKRKLLFLNGRPIRNSAFNAAIDQAYEEMCGKKGASFLLYVEVPHKYVDVNIHPAKQDVKLSNETLILMLVRQAVRDTLSRSFIPKVTGLKQESIFKAPEVNETAPFPEATDLLPPKASAQTKAQEARKSDAREKSAGLSSPAYVPNSKENAYIVAESAVAAASAEKEEPAISSFERGLLSSLPNMKFIGNAFGLYAILESADSLYIVDTHAAHERVLYEEYMDAFQGKTVSIQPLLAPLALSFPPTEYQAALGAIEDFARIGYELDDLGEGTLVIRAVPSILAQKGIENMFSGLLSELAAGAPLKDEEARSELLIKKACHHAVRGDSDISHSDLKLLLTKLSKTKMPFTCPHGRPTVSRMNQKAFMKAFERVQ